MSGADVRRRVGLGALAAVAATLVGALGACTDGSEPCGPFALETIADISGFRLDAVTVASDGNGGERVERAEPARTEASVETLRLVLEADYTTRFPEAGPSARRWTDLLIGSAHACSPPLLPVDASGTVSSIAVTSDTAWDERYPFGTPLDQLVSIASDTVFAGSEGVAQNSYQELSDFLAEAPTAPLSARLRIDEPPAGSGTHRFSVTVTLDDGRTWTVVSESVSVVGSGDA